MRVLVLGPSGMLGSMVLKYLTSKGIWTSCVGRSALDVGRVTGLEANLVDALEGYDWAINAIGMIKCHIKDDSATDVMKAIKINSIYPRYLARAAEATGCKIINIATDCVYSGAIGDYIETSPHDPTDVYGKTKSLGEVPSPNMMHLRCSIVGPELKTHKSLLDWFLGHAPGTTLNGFSHHHWNGITTLHFAKLCEGVINNNICLDGIQHVVPGNRMNKEEMLNLFKRVYCRDYEIVSSSSGAAINRTLVTNRPDKNLELWSAAGYMSPPTIEDMVNELRSFE